MPDPTPTDDLGEFVASYPDDLNDALHGHHGVKAERDARFEHARRLWRELRAASAALAAASPEGPRCFCPGGGDPDGLEHRPGCALAAASPPAPADDDHQEGT